MKTSIAIIFFIVMIFGLTPLAATVETEVHNELLSACTTQGNQWACEKIAERYGAIYAAAQQPLPTVGTIRQSEAHVAPATPLPRPSKTPTPTP